MRTHSPSRPFRATLVLASGAALLSTLVLATGTPRDAVEAQTSQACEALARLPLSGAAASAVQRVCTGGEPPAEAAAPGEPRQIVVGPNERVTTPAGPEARIQNEPHVGVSGDVKCSGFNDFNHGGANGLDTGFAFKVGAAPWVHPGPLPLGPFTSIDGDPVVAVDRGGLFNVVSLADVGAALADFVVVSSSAGCQAFDPPVAVSGVAGTGTLDKPWIAADLRAGPAPAGDLYACWTDFSGTGAPFPAGVHSIRAASGPPGGPFAPAAPGFLVRAAPPDTFVQGCQVAVDQTTGDVLFAWWEVDAVPGLTRPRLFFRQCLAGLAGCAPEVQITPLPPAPGAIVPIAGTLAGCSLRAMAFPASPFGPQFMRVQEWPAMAVSPTGIPYVVWADARLGDADIFFAAGPGGVFGPPVRVNRDAIGNGIRQFLPAIAVAPNGMIKVTWYDERRDPQAGLDLFAAVSVDGGASWAEERVTDGPGTPFPVVAPPPGGFLGVAGCYMGDYNGVAADAASHFHMVWGDNRDPAPIPQDRPNVYYDREVPLGDHYLCYGAKDRTPGRQNPGVVNLVDQFQHAAYDVRPPRFLCAPADKNGEGVIDPVTHLKSYKIKRVAGEHLQPTVAIKNQFGTLQLHVRTESELMVPSSKRHGLPADPPDPTLPGFEHYKCYRTSTIADKRPLGIIVEAVDQFGFTKLVVRKATRLCNPVSKNGSTIKSFDRHLVCYGVKALARPVLPADVKVNNQFGDEIVRLKRVREICVPSLKFRIN
jgi:hypothetical protein